MIFAGIREGTTLDRNPYKPKQVCLKHVARVVLCSQCSDPINLMDS